MASDHQPAAPSLEFSNDSDSDCNIIDSGSEVEIQYDETESESVDLESDDEMTEASKSSACEEAISDNTDVDTIDDSGNDNDFGPNVTDRIVWGNLFALEDFLK